MSPASDFAQRLGALLDVPLITCERAADGSEFHYPTGERDTLSAAENRAQLAKWRPGLAIMAAMGGNVAAVDVDTRNGADVEKTRQMLDGLRVRVYAEIETPSGGRHFYVAGHEELASAHNLNGWPGIDVQSYGSLLFLPGTQRPKYSGGGYRIIFEDLEMLADGGDPDGAAALAGWVAEHRGGRTEFEPATPWNGKPPTVREMAYLDATLRRMHTELSGMRKDSGRNTAAFNAALACGNYIAGAGLDEARAVAALLDASNHNGLIREDGEASVRATIQSGIHNGRARPRAVPMSEAPTSEPPEPPEPEPEPEPEPSSWQRVDLTSVLDGTWQPSQPTIGRRTDGKGLFYPGKTHTGIGETEAGKGWFALSAAVDEMADGHNVVYVDFEDDQATVVGRLLTMGIGRDLIKHHFHYIRPENPLTGRHLEEFLAVLNDTKPTLALLDGVTEAMTLHSLNPLDNVDIALFNAAVVKHFVVTGAAQVSLDHVTKSTDGRGKYALGGVHKLNIVSGAGYILENRNPFGIGIKGVSTVRIAKDRPGQLRINAVTGSNNLHWYGDLVLESHGEGLAEVSIEPPHELHSEDYRPTVYMERIAKALTKHGQLASQRQVEAAVQGKTTVIRDALQFLILDGYVTDKQPYKLIKAYP
jgi:hypothetical protein